MLTGYGSYSSSKNNVNFVSTLADLEEEINETRKELNLCKKDVQILNSERETILEMSEQKCSDISKYLHKEINSLE